jgi:hypothetical protein
MIILERERERERFRVIRATRVMMTSSDQDHQLAILRCREQGALRRTRISLPLRLRLRRCMRRWLRS